MTQRALEAALGKLICDDVFRAEFYDAAERAVTCAGFELTAVELTSLHKIELDSIEEFAASVDERVRRAAESTGARRKRAKRAKLGVAK